MATLSYWVQFMLFLNSRLHYRSRPDLRYRVGQILAVQCRIKVCATSPLDSTTINGIRCPDGEFERQGIPPMASSLETRGRRNSPLIPRNEPWHIS
jgi:hypothetical protein